MLYHTALLLFFLSEEVIHLLLLELLSTVVLTTNKTVCYFFKDPFLFAQCSLFSLQAKRGKSFESLVVQLTLPISLPVPALKAFIAYC